MLPEVFLEKKTMTLQAFELNRVEPNCGAELRGIDLSQPLNDDTIESLKMAVARHCVLFFRDQKITPEQHKRFSQYFGQLHIHPAWPRLVDGHPEIMELYTDENTKRIGGEIWHSDVSCDLEPPLGTVLRMIEVPPVGGDTLFANMYAAYESLSSSMQRFLEGMTAVHDGEPVYRGRYGPEEENDKVYPRSEHPVIRTHPLTGGQALFVNRIFTTRIVQLTKRESDTLLRMLWEHVERPEIQCRFQWQPDSVAFWDNRCTQHYALWDYYPHRRHAMRVTIRGETPFYRS